MCSAIHLLRRGVSDVTVVDRGHPAAGSSGLSVGVIETQYVDPLEIELRVRAMRFFAELERDHGLGITRTGYLRLAHTGEQAESYADSVELQHELGVKHAEVLGPTAIGALVPDLCLGGIQCGLWGPDDGFIDGHLYCSLLAELLETEGASLRVREEVVGAERLPDGRHRVVTSRGEVTAEHVVNAAGAWAPAVGERIGARLPITPQRHEAVVVHLPRELPYVMPMVMDYTPHSGELGLYFRHERPGQLIAGLHSEEQTSDVDDPDRYGRSASPEFLEGVAELISQRLPTLAESGLAHGWAGLYPVSPDGLPQVGPSAEKPSIISAGGAGGSGIQLSPVIGELVADWIIHGEPRAVAQGRRLDPRRPSITHAGNQ